MNDREWAEFAARLEASFRGGLTEDRERELRRYIGNVPFDVACRALARLILGEHDTASRPPPAHIFLPTPSEFIVALRRETGAGWPLKVALSGLTSDELAEHVNGARGDLIGLLGGER